MMTTRYLWWKSTPSLKTGFLISSESSHFFTTSLSILYLVGPSNPTRAVWFKLKWDRDECGRYAFGLKRVLRRSTHIYLKWLSGFWPMHVNICFLKWITRKVALGQILPEPLVRSGESGMYTPTAGLRSIHGCKFCISSITFTFILKVCIFLIYCKAFFSLCYF